jgi:hypothetical protein
MAPTVGQGWTPETWLALAGVLAAIVGVVASLVGVKLGARLNQEAVAQERIQQSAELALVKSEIALDDARIDSLTTDLLDLDPAELEARLKILSQEDSLAVARDALATLRVNHPSKDVQQHARSLEVDLVWVYPLTLRWFRLSLENFRNGQVAKAEVEAAFEKANEAQTRTSAHWERLREAIQLAKPSRRRSWRAIG